MFTDGQSAVGEKSVLLNSLQTNGQYAVTISQVSDYCDLVRVTQTRSVTLPNKGLLEALQWSDISKKQLGVLVEGAVRTFGEHELREIAEGLAGIVNSVYNPNGKLQPPTPSFEIRDGHQIAYFMAHYSDGPAEVAKIKVANPEELRAKVFAGMNELKMVKAVL